MLGKNHKKVNRIALIPISSYIIKYQKENFIKLLPDNTFLAATTIILALIVYDLTSRLPDIDKKPYIPFKHRTWLHSVWGLIIICYLAYTKIETQPYLIIFALSFSISYYLHLQMDDFSIMGCDMFYPLFGYREYHEGKVKYRKGPLHFELYDTGSDEDKKNNYKIVKGRRVKKKSEKKFVNKVIVFLVLLTCLIIFS